MAEMRDESEKRLCELERIRQSMEREKDEVDALNSQRKNLEVSINNARKEKQALEDGQKEAQRRIVELKRWEETSKNFVSNGYWLMSL